MKKIMIILLSFFAFNSVYAEDIHLNIDNISYFYKMDYDDFSRTEEFILFKDIFKDETYFTLSSFRPQNYNYSFTTKPVKYRNYYDIKYFTNEELNQIQKVMFWGDFYEGEVEYYKNLAIQIQILNILNPTYTITPINRGGEELKHVSVYVNEINKLMSGNIEKLNNINLTKNVLKSININLDNFNISTSSNVEYEYKNKILTLKGLDNNKAFITLNSKYDDNIHPTFLKNNYDQYLIKKENNIDFKKTYNISIINVSENIKENPETGNYLNKLIILLPILFLFSIPLIIYILIKELKTKV